MFLINATFSCFELSANQHLSKLNNLWFNGTHVTNSISQNICHNILCCSLALKEHYFVSHFHPHNTCLSARFLLLHCSGFGFKHVLSTEQGALHSQTDCPTENGGNCLYTFTSCACNTEWCQHTTLPERISKCQISNSKQGSMDYRKQRFILWV